MTIINTIITDRTSADVARAKTLISKWAYTGTAAVWTGTEEELSEYWAGCKGAYNAADLNRVGGAVEYIAARLNSYSYPVAVSAKTDWVSGDIPTKEQLDTYLDNVSRLKKAFSVKKTTPALPESMDKLTVDKANAIEQILTDIDELLSNMASAWFYSGDLYAGEV